jgi:hypothetical protein
VRVRDLLAITDLRLVLRTGAEGLDRRIRWVYTTELVLPGRYLSGDELVLTGLMWREGLADPDGLVSTLVAARAAALGVGTAVHGFVPPPVIDACRRHGLPLIEVPADVSFGTVSEVVTRRLMAGAAAAPRPRRRLISAAAEGAGLSAVLAEARAELGLACWVVSPTGRIVAGPADGLPPERARELAAEFLAAEFLAGEPGAGECAAGDRTSPAVRSGGGHTLLPVGARTGHRLTGWFLACAGEPTHEEAREAAYELAALAALERARVEEGRRVERRLVAGFAGAAGAGDPGDPGEPGETAARLRSCGLSPTEPHLAVSAVVTGVSGVTGAGEVAGAVLDELLHGTGAVVGSLGDEGIALVPAGEAAAPVAELRAAADLLRPALARGRLTIGVSGPAHGPGPLRAALEEARHTRRAVAARPGPVDVVTSDEIPSYALMLAAVPAPVHRSFRDRVLGPLRDYDAERGSDLVHTLEVFLECSGSWSRCAARLHVHVNTLRYRIRRVEELTGRDLGTFEDRVDLFLALRAT